MYEQGYGNEQAMMTMNRAAYGDIPAAMMGGAYGGSAGGLSNMMADVGRVVMPISYSAPFRPMAGFYGTYQQPQGMAGSGAAAFGFTTVPRGTSTMGYVYNAAGDFGERLGGGLVGAGVAGVSALAMTAGIGSSLGGLGGAAIGSTIGLSAAGAALGAFAAPIALAGYGASAVTNAVQERRQIQNFLESSSFRFTGSGSSMVDTVMGSGMSRGARQEMGEFMRGMDIKDKTMNMGDLTQIMKQGTSLGLFNGTQDVQDFQRKFKDITESVKTVTKALNQTLEEGMKTIADLKGIGVDPSQARSVVGQAVSLGNVAGRTGQEMIGLGLQGAEMFRGTGVTMGIGFQASQMNLASVRAARDAGTLSQEAISQAGGEEALALRMAAGGLSFAQSTMGRGFGAAFLGPGGGLNTGGFMNAMMSGGGSFLGNVQAGATNLSSPAALISYQANQAKFMSDMGAQFGGRGLEMAMLGSSAGYAEYIAGATGAKKEDAFRLSLLQQGKSTSEIDAYMAQIKDPNAMFKTMQSGVAANRSRVKMDEASDNFILTRMGAAVGDKVKSVIDLAARPLNKAIDDVAQGVQTATMEYAYGAISASSVGVDTSNIGPLSTADRTKARLRAGPLNLDRASTFGNVTSGEAALKVLEGNGMADFMGVKVRTVKDKSEITADDVILNEGGNFSQTKIMSRSDYAKFTQKSNVLGMTLADAETVAKGTDLAGLAKMSGGNTMLGLIGSGRLSKITNKETLIKELTGSTELNENSMAHVLTQIKGMKQFEDMMAPIQRAGAIAADSAVNADIIGLRQSRDIYEKGKSTVESALGFSLSSKAAGSLAAAAAANNPKERADLLNKAIHEQMQAPGSPGATEIEKRFNAALTGDQAGLKDMYTGAVGIEAIKASSGSNAMSVAVGNLLLSKEGAGLSLEQKNLVKDAELLIGSGSPRSIKNIATNKAMLEAISAGGGGAIAKQLGDIGALIGEKKPDSDIDAAVESFQKTLDRSTGVAAASGPASTSGDVNMQNATQSAEVQMNVNLQTLAAMQGLAAKLGVR